MACTDKDLKISNKTSNGRSAKLVDINLRVQVVVVVVVQTRSVTLLMFGP